MVKKSRVHADLLVGDPRKIKTLDNKRSNHPDFATSTELKDMGFSGYRLNVISNMFEIWVGGIKRADLQTKDGVPDPEEFKVAYRKIFGVSLDHAAVSVS